MRISACLIVNLVRVHVKGRKTECNFIANGRTESNKLFVSLSSVTASFRHESVNIFDGSKTNIVPISEFKSEQFANFYMRIKQKYQTRLLHGALIRMFIISDMLLRKTDL